PLDHDAVRTIDRPRRVVEQRLLLLRRHEIEQGTRLREVIVVVLPEIPRVRHIPDSLRRIPELGLLLPLAVAVRLVVQLASAVAVDPHRTVTMEAVGVVTRS